MHELAPRTGATPEIIGPAPHGQVSQIPPITVQEELWQRMRALPDTYMAPTLVSVPHARALFLPEGIGDGPPEAFQRGREFVHLHPHHDGSLHITLPGELKSRVEQAGWGVRHPQQHSILIYGPRDRAELDTVWHLVHECYRYATGGSTGQRGPGNTVV